MRLVERLARLYHARVDWKLRQFYLVAFFLFYMLAGAMHNPLWAFVIAGLYQLGFFGLTFIMKASVSHRGFDLALGGMLILVSTVWLEVLYAF